MTATSEVPSKVLEGLNPKQVEAVTHLAGPLLVIAGPGSGKTHTLVRRTLYIIEQNLAKPEEIVLCTFTEKAALELRDRVRNEAAKLGITADMSGLIVGTIHGIANDFLDKYRHKTPLGNNFAVLDELTKLLFMNDNFDALVDGFAAESDDGREKYFNDKWATKWTAIKGMQGYFSRIAEEMLDVNALKQSDDELVSQIAESYERYRALLLEQNAVDFEHLQVFFHQLLANTTEGQQVLNAVKFVMVDEYQDTNYVQEQLVLKLASASTNICVVGDEDQSLYRFRGATVRNILEFPGRVKNCHEVILNINYRSHVNIVKAYDSYMKSHDWVDADKRRFRFDKTIVADPEGVFPDYPAVLRISGTSKGEEAQRLADFVKHLLDHGIVKDASQVALLLRSVKSEHSLPYIEALRERGIKSFCPRARGFFELEEIRLVVGALAVILEYVGDNRSKNPKGALLELDNYVDACLLDLNSIIDANRDFGRLMKRLNAEITNMKPGETLNRRVADYMYEFLAVSPFREMVGEANQSRSLAAFSQMLATFQQFYGFTVITAKNLQSLRSNLFTSFLRLLHEGGLNEYEDPDQAYPKGHVPIMTIHQSKGLEFPVTIVGSLNVASSSGKELDRNLGEFYHRPVFEPEQMITGFDRMRLHYVAYSRAEKILVLTADTSAGIPIQPWHKPIWDAAKDWGGEAERKVDTQSWDPRAKLPPKKPYSFTGDLKAYETCPRQYQLYRLFEFEPSRAVLITFGLLVHQTIEDIHRLTLEGRGAEVNAKFITDRFEFNYRHLMARATRKMAPEQKDAALQHVMRYWQQNQAEIARVKETEVDVSLEKDDYILHGAIDLVLGDAGTLEVLDFKAQTRPADTEVELIATYYKQLCIYAHILEQRKGITPTKLHIYWTGEMDKKRALMSFDYKREDVEGAASHFDEVVRDIQAEKFKVVSVPDEKVCNECDFKPYCESVGTIKPTRRKRRRF
jgi:DNA helicase-2/ATP-dependent DNA helicase PcrA